MSSVALIVVGAALFANGLLLLGRIDATSAGVLNLFVGVLQTAIACYLIAAAGTSAAMLDATGALLFGVTFLYVGACNLADRDSAGIGWYSAWVALVALGFGVTSIVRLHDASAGLLWLQWSVLWTMFFLVAGLRIDRLAAFTGWSSVFVALTTCTVPGFSRLLGEPDQVPTWGVLAAVVTTVAALVPAVVRRFEPSPPGLLASVPAGRVVPHDNLVRRTQIRTSVTS